MTPSVPACLDGGQSALRCGILIVGSLFWQNDERGIRDDWRKNRLDLTGKFHVSSPIRYGRRSSSWGRAFTMIFETGAAGQGILVPCRAPVTTFYDLLDEIHWLWAAEDRNPPCELFRKGWGCVGAMFGAQAIGRGLQNAWRGHFESVQPWASPAIDGEGRLDIEWPRMPDGELVTDIDIILGTATMPDPKDKRPKPAEIASAWIEQDEGHERYFFENVRHGIRTDDDREIWQCIEERRPRWLERDAYASVIEQLRAEVAPPRRTDEV